MELKDKIKNLRLKNGMTQEQFAVKTGFNVTTINKYELGQRVPKETQLKQIAGAFDLSPYYFSDFSITNSADLFLIMTQIYQQTGLSIDAEKDTAGNIIPETLRFSCNDKVANERLAAFFSLVLKMSDNDIQSESNDRKELVEKIIDLYDRCAINNNTSIQSDTKDIMNRSVKPENLRELENLYMDCSPKEIDYLVKSTKLFINYLKDKEE